MKNIPLTPLKGGIGTVEATSKIPRPNEIAPLRTSCSGRNDD